ncbi:serine/arginine repetitive matrix protein 2-like isoform X1 [Procambarus clarkii]|uniref:serine/arginine repetitive matrix protein 2-like isoform X1 n=2 Tax=Procambarus clarkii TaxID=6728 RepID=UPI003742F582
MGVEGSVGSRVRHLTQRCTSQTLTPPATHASHTPPTALLAPSSLSQNTRAHAHHFARRNTPPSSFLLNKTMKIYGHVVVIMRTGEDGTPFPLTYTSCTIGRNQDCDIRIHLSTVSRLHCKIDVDSKGKAFLTNLSQVSPTILNKIPMATEEISVLEHRDIITVEEREFRWEYPEGSVFASSSRNDQLMYKILTPTTKSPISHHNVNSDSSGMKCKGFEAIIQECPDAKRKRVSFGPQLHPEHFDKLLPPDTPISKGEKPNTLTLLNISESSHSAARKSKRISLPPLNIAIAEESGIDTPTKSLLRRRSPTPVKPYIARSLGLLVPKVLNDGSPNAQNDKDGSPKQKACSDHKPLTRSSFDSVSDIDDSPKMAKERSSKVLPTFPSTCKVEDSEPSKKVVFRNSLRNSDISRSLHQVTTTISSPMRDMELKVALSKIELHKTTPKRAESSEAITNKADTLEGTPSRAQSPKGTLSRAQSPKGTPSRAQSPKGTPSRAQSPKGTPSRAQSPKGTPSRAQSPKGTPSRAQSPKGTPSRAQSPKGTPSRAQSPKGTPSRAQSPKGTPSRAQSPKGTPSRAQSPKGTPSRAQSPKGTPSRAQSPKGTPSRAQSPKGTPSRAQSPKGTPSRAQSPKGTPSRAQSPKGTPSRAQSPKGTPSRAQSPKGTPSRAQSPKGTPSRAQSPKGTPSRAQSPKGTPSRAQSPKGTPSRAQSPKGTPSRAQSPKGTPSRAQSPKGTPSRAQSPKGTPSRAQSPKGTPSRAQSPKGIPSRAQSPKGIPSRAQSPKGIPSRAQSPKGIPSRAQSPKGIPSRAQSPKGIPSRAQSPKGTPSRAQSPKGTPSRAQSPKGTPSRAQSPKGTPSRAQSPKGSPKRAQSPKGSPKRAQSPKGSPKRAQSPKGSPKRAQSPKGSPKRAQSPKGSPKRAQSPKGSPKRAQSPKGSPKRAQSPKGSPKRAQSPKGSPKRAQSPKGSPKRAQSPKGSPKRAQSPKGSPKRAQSPKGSPKRAQSPKGSPKRAQSPKGSPKRTQSPKGAPNRARSPKGTPGRAQTPKETANRAWSPKATPRRADLPESDTKIAKLLKDAPKRVRSGDTPQKVELLQVSPKKGRSPNKVLSSKVASLKLSRKEVCVVASPLSPKKVASPLSPKEVELSTLKKVALLSASHNSPKKSELSVSSSKKRSSLRVQLQHIILPKNAKRSLHQSLVSSPYSSLINSPQDKKRKASLTPLPHVLKRLKTGASTPNSVQKIKTSSRKTPAKIVKKTPKKSWADVLKRGLMANGVPCSRIQRSNQVMRRARGVRANKRSAFKSKLPTTVFEKEIPKKFEFGQTTGHANSPASIFIHKKTCKTPKVFRKGRKSPLKAVFATSSSGKYDNLEGLRELLATPTANRRERENSPVIKENSSMKEDTPQSASRKLSSKTPSPMKTPAESSNEELMESLGTSPALFSPATPSTSKSVRCSIGNRYLSQISHSASYINMTNFDFSSIKTPDVTEDNFISPLVTPATSNKTPEHLIRRSTEKSFMASPVDIHLETDATTFDFENARTPDVSQLDFVSPVSTRSKNSSRVTEYDSVVGRKSLLSTPKPIGQFCKGLPTDEHGIKRLLRTPRAVASTPKVIATVKNICKTSLKGEEYSKIKIPSEVKTDHFVPERNDFKRIAIPFMDNVEANDRGMQLRVQEQTPKSPQGDENVMNKSKQSPNVYAAGNLKGNYTDGVKFMRTPKTASPDSNNPKNVDSANIRKILQHPEPVQDSKADYTDVRGVRKLMKTPKAAGSIDNADEAHIIAIRRILRTPKSVSDSPKADYSKVAGVRALLKTPNTTAQGSPKADYTDVRGVKKLMKTPKAAVPDDTDETLTAIREILCTPKRAQGIQNSDCSDVGFKNQIKTPITTNLDPTIEYSNIAGLDRLNICLKQIQVSSEKDSAPECSNFQVPQKLFRTPSSSSESKEPIADYSEPKGLKKLLATPRQKKCSPFSDYTNVAGMKKLLSTPHTPFNSPEADYTNVRGLRALMRTPKVKDNSLEIDLEGLSQLMTTPLSDHTNMVKKIVELVQHSSTPESSRKLHSSLKVSPATSSPSENIPPVEDVNNHAKNEDGTPRRSQRNARAKKPEVTEPVRRGRSRKGGKNETIFQSHAVEFTLEQIESSPVVPERSLRSRRKVNTVDKQVLAKKKSRKGKMTSEEEIHNSSIESKSYETSPLVVENRVDAKSLEAIDTAGNTQERQTISSSEINNTSGKVSPRTSTTLPVRKRRNQKKAELEVPIASQSKRRKTKIEVTEEFSQISSPVLENSVSSMSSGKTIGGQCESTPVRRGRGRKNVKETGNSSSNSTSNFKYTDELKINQVANVENIDLTPSRTRKTRAQLLLNVVQDKSDVCCEIREDGVSTMKQEEFCNKEDTQTSTPVRRGRGRKKALETEDSSTSSSSKATHSKHTNELKINSVASAENIDLTPSRIRTRKTRAQQTEVQEEAAPKKSRRGRLQKKEESEIEQPMAKVGKNVIKKTVTVEDVNENTFEEQAIRITRRGRTRVEDNPEESVPVTRRKKGNVKLESKVEEQNLDSEIFPESKKNESKSKKREVEPEVIAPKTRSTRNKKESKVSVDKPSQKRKADSAVEEVETTPVTRSRRNNTEEESYKEMTRRTRARK